MSVGVETFGTGKVSNNRIIEIIRENFELQPTGIIEMLNLRQPIYKKTAAYGHFGRGNCGFPWEKTDKAEIIKKISVKG